MHTQLTPLPEEPNFDSPKEIREGQTIPILVIGNLCKTVRASLEDNLEIKGIIYLSHQGFQSLDQKFRTNTILIKDEEQVPSKPVEERTETLKTLNTIESEHLESLPDDHIIIIVSNTKDQMRGFFKNRTDIKDRLTISDETPEAVIRTIFLRIDTLLQE